jgi:hypothetical protein
LLHEHPSELPQKGVDVFGAPFSDPAIDLNREGLPTSFTTSPIEDHIDIEVTREAPLHRLVHLRVTTRNDQQSSLHSPRSTPPGIEKSGSPARLCLG